MISDTECLAFFGSTSVRIARKDEAYKFTHQRKKNPRPMGKQYIQNH